MIKFLQVVILFYSSCIFAVLELKLTQGVDNAIPLTVLPFAGAEVVKEHSITEVISNDLKNSGRFRLVVEQTADKIDFGALRSKKIEGVLVGKVKALANGRVLIAVKLFDVYNKNELFAKEYTVKLSQLRRLAHHISDIVYQQFTGDRGIFSTKIAYVLVKRKGSLTEYKLQVADSDGHNPRTLLESKFPLMSPAWSPDGKKIAYVSFEGNRAAIYAQDLATGKRQLVSKSPGINGAPAWSPDGKRMALVLTQTGYPKIYVLDLATQNLERLTDAWYLDTEPNWAPDGKSLIFTSNRGGGPQIYQIYLDSKKIERVTFDGPYNARASFTPNGKAIVMLHQTGDMFSIALEDLQSGYVTILTQSGFNESPSIAPNGKMVVYGTNYQGKGMLAEVAVDGKVKLLLPAGDGEVQEPAWSPFIN